jgi:hypothetical protein
MEEMKQQKTVAPNEPTVWVRTSSIYPTLSLNQDKDAPILELQHLMNQRWSSGSSDGHEDANSKVSARSPSAPYEPTHHRCIASDELCNGHVRWRATVSSTRWTDARKSIVSDHLMVLLSAAFSQRLVWCFRLFIPPPLAHLRLLDCVEVHKSARHLEDHIQSIQVLNCSSIDLYTLCVRALSARLSLELSECKVVPTL